MTNTTNTAESKKTAEARIRDLIATVQQQPESDMRRELLEECEALQRAVAAFHLEGIRFRAYNVGRLLQKNTAVLPPAAAEAFNDMRRHLEDAGFHTRSHQSPV
jgi:hypothetical protein